MNKWFKLALFAFVGIIALNLILSLFVTPMGYGGYGYYGSYKHNGYNMPMHNGQMMRGMMYDNR